MLTQNLLLLETRFTQGDATACRPRFQLRRPIRGLVRPSSCNFRQWPAETLSLDPSEPAFLEDPYPTLSRLREAAPVFYDDERERWFVTRHEDVRACLRDKRLGRNFRHVMTPEEIGVPPLDPRWQAFWETERWSLLWLEPPDHTRIRKLVAAAFTPRASRRCASRPTGSRAKLLEPLAETGEMELLYDYAQPYSIAVICRMLGVPLDRHRDLLDWSHRMVKMYEFDVPLEAATAANRARRSFATTCVELIGERRAQAARRHGQRARRGARRRRAALGGRDRQHRDRAAERRARGDRQHARQRHARVRAPSRAVATRRRRRRSGVSGDEELIRYDPPLQLFERWVLTDDFAIGDVAIPRGAKISMLFGSANRDPRVFERPDEFDVGRENAAQHIGFGGGIHVCIGAPLARIELEASVEVLRRYWPDFSWRRSRDARAPSSSGASKGSAWRA